MYRAAIETTSITPNVSNAGQTKTAPAIAGAASNATAAIVRGNPNAEPLSDAEVVTRRGRLRPNASRRSATGDNQGTPTVVAPHYASWSGPAACRRSAIHNRANSAAHARGVE